MALQGSLAQLGLSDVLQSSLGNRRQGNLVLRRGAERAVLHLAEDGIYLLEPEVLEAKDVLQSFVDRGRLSPTDAEQALAETPDPIQAIDVLVQQGGIREADLVDLLSQAVEDAIVDLLTWHDGDFRFDEGAERPAIGGLGARVPIDSGSFLLRAAHRIDEHEAVAAALGWRPVLFLRTSADAPPARGTTDACPAVWNLLDGRSVVSEIALKLGLGRLAVLRALLELVQAGAARVATSEELAAAVDARIQEGQVRIARTLLFQWTEAKPLDPEPYQKLADLAVSLSNSNDEADALLQLGHLLLKSGDSDGASKAYDRVLRIRPADRDALGGRRSAAQASGDDAGSFDATIELARSAIADGDAERAAALLQDLPGDAARALQVRLLRARAYVRLKDTIAVVAEVEAIGALLGAKCRKRQEREAASFCRDAIASIAPDRSDLLRRFRMLAEGGRVRSRRVAIVGALVAVVGCGGFLLWPPSAASLLEKARKAMDEGRKDEATEIVVRLVDKFPDSAEAEEAFRIQNAMAQKSAPSRPTGPTDPVLKKHVDSNLPGWLAALRALPAQEGRTALIALVQTLEKPEAASMRPAVFRQSATHLLESTRVLSFEARTRADTIARMRQYAAAGKRANVDALRELMKEVRTYLEDEWADEFALTQSLFARLVALAPEDAFRVAGREMQTASKSLQNARKVHTKDYQDCRVILAGYDVEADYEACREDAPKLLVAGRLEDADKLYARLADRLASFEKEPMFAPVLEAVQKRQIPQFLRERRGVIEEIRKGLDAATASERAGDLAGAAQQYAVLAKRFWMVRFENVFTVPLQVETLPPGGRVFINGRDSGTSPVMVRYGWGSQTTISVESPGFEPETEQLSTADPSPRTKLVVHLVPKTRWTAPIDPVPMTRPVAAGEHVLLSDRGGRLTLLAGDDGHVLWTRQMNSLEGVRSRPAVLGPYVYLPMVEGKLHVLSLADGSVLETLDVGRTTLDAATEGDTVAVATASRRLIGLRGKKRTMDVPLSGDPVAGVASGHGAFWVGHGVGIVDRLDAATGARTTISLEPSNDAVVGLAATPDGMLATTADGMLFVLDAAGGLRWKTASLGDLVGTPARAGDVVAVVDRQGRVLLFDAKTGAPRGQAILEGGSVGGLVSFGRAILATSASGRFWAFATDVSRAMVDSETSATSAPFGPALVGAARAVVSWQGRSAALLDLSALLPEPAPSPSR